MKFTLSLALCFCCFLGTGRAALDQKESRALIDSVNQRVSAGDAKALDDLKPLRRNDAIGTLLLFFKENYYVRDATPQQKAIVSKAVKLIIENPEAEGYFKELWKKPPGTRTGFVLVQRETAFDCLAEANNKLAVRVLCEALSEPDLVGQTHYILRLLLKTDVPSPPYPRTLPPAKLPAGSTGATGLAKWQKWWQEHKSEYVDTPKEPVK